MMNRKIQKGFTIIEILVSVTILTIGLLGILAMHLRSYSTVQNAEKIGLIAGLTETLAEAMRTNPQIVASGATDVNGNPIMTYRWTNYEGVHYGSTLSCSPTLSKPTGLTGVNSSTLANYHRCNFENQFKAALGETFKYEICRANAKTGQCSSSNSDYIIKVTWPVDSSGDEVSDSFTHFVVVNLQ